MRIFTLTAPCMEFHSIYTTRRIGSDKVPKDNRSGFQRDYDRLIFSSAFRRLQNKTQVFPLPGTAFVHNRLTHSLEVASVGRSLGKMVGETICEQYKSNNEAAYEFYKYELANVIAAACLAHDIGNPAFGHSGEKAISAFFTDNQGVEIEGRPLRHFFTEKEWADVSNFEGNANAVRILTHSFKGRFSGGFGLTYTTIASILKYPCESVGTNKEIKHRKKYGFFQSERALIERLGLELGLIQESSEPLIFRRHPFVYLVEAADDICYSIVDMEDAHRLGILSQVETRDAFMEVIKGVEKNSEVLDKTWGYYGSIKDTNEAIAFLRAKVINVLTHAVAQIFCENAKAMLAGGFNDTLIDNLQKNTGALDTVQQLSRQKIYNHDTVLQIEIAGYNVMSELLELYVPALLKSTPSHKEEKVLKLFPFQYRHFEEASSPYQKVLGALDHLSAMTDEYATEMYRRLKGIVIPGHG